MANQKNFAIVPNVSISRSKFKRPSQHKTSFNLGEIIPIYCDEVLPGDTRSITVADMVRMSNVIAPIMDNIQLDIYFFFVPNRLTWNHWKDFMGENTESAGAVDPTDFSIPSVVPSDSIDIDHPWLGSIGDYFGLPNCPENDYYFSVSELPLRGYGLIYNRFFRDQNLIAPVAISLGDTSQSDSGVDELHYTDKPFKAAKLSDYFTRALPYAQKGSPVALPLGTTAPVKALNNDNEFEFSGTDAPGLSDYGVVSAVSGEIPLARGSSLDLVVDLSKATAATINDLRFAFQYQKLLEKDALYGTRYWEILKAHFGVDAPDASLQDPEYLGHMKQMINVQEVTQTTGIDQATPANNELGQVAAKSVTGGKGHIFNKSFVEHGYIIGVCVARHDQTYGQGVNRMWTRKTRTDFYMPVFANLGAQEIKNKEIFADTEDYDKVFGYQEAWADYRYKPSIVSGLLNPSVANSLGFWTLANNFAELPTLGKTFIEQDRSNLARALSTGDNGPDFIADFYFLDIAIRPMPTYSIPGLIDHH